MSEKTDILITYSKLDDRPETNDLGWVTSMKNFLEALLQQMLKQPIRIATANENDDHSRETYEGVSALVTVLTPNFSESNLLITGLQNYLSSLKSTKESDNLDSRLFKVLKTPVDLKQLPKDIHSLIDYTFFEYNTKTGEIESYDRFFGGVAEKKFWMKLVDLAYDLSQVLVVNHPEYAVYEKIKKGDEVIYLAECGVDLVNQRDVIRRELIRYGYKVLPAKSLTRSGGKIEANIVNDLKKSNLSIHLIGEDYGKIPEGYEKSLIELENQLATEYSLTKEAREKPGGFRRLIWITPKFTNLTERQKIFIEDLRSDAESLENAEILQTSIHDLRTVLRNQLIYKQVNQSRFNEEDEAEKGPSMIYLIVDRDDVDEIKPLEEFLHKEGFKVLSSVFDGDLIDLRNIHHENLRKCDGSIIYYGKANEEWMKTKIQDLLKSPGFGRKRPMKVKAIISSEDRKIDSAKLARTNALVLYKKDQITDELLLPFLERLKN